MENVIFNKTTMDYKYTTSSTTWKVTESITLYEEKPDIENTQGKGNENNSKSQT